MDADVRENMESAFRKKRLRAAPSPAILIKPASGME
jgi:hypothetical protein